MPRVQQRRKVTKRYETVVIAKCVGCKAKREVLAGEVAPGDMPQCKECFSVMVAEKAERRLVKQPRRGESR